MKKLLFGLGLLVPFLVSAQLTPHSLTASNGEQVGFYEFKPADYNSNPSGKFPLLIFLHGIGERGDGTTTLSSVLNAGIPHYINMGATMRFNVNGQWQTFLVLAPQLNFNYGSWQNFYVDEMLNYARNNLRIDPSRIYLTGLSLGGGGVWKYASASATNAAQFAAIVPVCGTCDFSNLCNITQSKVPVWAFHAMDDGVVGVGCTQAAISSLNSCNPAIPPKVTYYPTGNHWIWDQAYDTTHNVQSPQNVFEWMLSQSRNGSVTPPPPTGNIPPVANAGSAQTITAPASAANLTGSSSYDQDGTIVGYSWSQVSGPGTAAIYTPTSANTTVGSLLPGTYVFRLKVTDNAGATATADVQVTVNAGTTISPAQGPVAVAGADQTVTLPTNKTYLAGSGSYVQGGGTINSYVWSQVSGPNTATLNTISSTNVEAANLIGGTYVFKLTVSNAAGSSSATMQVIVNGGSTTAAPTPVSGYPVVANAGSNQTITLPTNSLYLAGSGSYSQGGGSITSYSWSQVSGPNQATIAAISASNIQASNLVGGVYVFRLTVTNSSGNKATADVQVTVNGGTSTPTPTPVTGFPVVANGGSNQTITLPTSSVSLQGSGSYSQGGGSITSYVWTQVSGPNQPTVMQANASNIMVSNMVAGVYVFRLKVTNSSGNTATADVQVTVNGQAAATTGNPVVADAGTNQWISLPVSAIYLQASGSYSQGGGYITSYVWSQVSGPNQAVISSISPSNIQVSNLIAGVYVFRVKVTNNFGNTSTADVTVTVNGAPVAAVAAAAVASVDVAAAAPLSVYPNPAISTVTIEINNNLTGTVQLNFVDAGGKTAKSLTASKTATNFKQQVDVTTLAAGTYVVEIRFNDGSSLTKSIVKQ